MIDSKTRLQPSSHLVRRLSVAVVSAIALSLGSCVTSAPTTNSGSPQAQSSPLAKRLVVVTTFIPITDFTKAVAGDRAEVAQLLPSNVGPHDFQAKPEDAQKLAKADVLVENGLGLEEFLDDLVKNAENPNLKVIDSSKGIQTITTESLEGHDHKHGVGEKKAEAGHDHGEFNPHIWLDPRRAIQQVENIRDGLIAADPEGKETYTANAAAYIIKLQQLDQEFSQKFQPFAGKTFVTYHDFAPYFAQRYNLKVQFLVGIPEENASPDDVKRVINAVKASNLKTLLTEPQVVGNPFFALAKDLNVQVSNFDPMETAGADGIQSDRYFTIMRQNVTNLTTAFGGQSTQSFLPTSLLRVAVVPQTVGFRF